MAKVNFWHNWYYFSQDEHFSLVETFSGRVSDWQSNQGHDDNSFPFYDGCIDRILFRVCGVGTVCF